MKKEVLKELTAKPGKEHHVSDFNPSFTADMSKQDAKEQLAPKYKKAIRTAKYALCTRPLLSSGYFSGDGRCRKTATIKHVMSGINPQGCQVYSFKQPSAEELDDHYLWKINRSLSRTGTNRNLQPFPI